MKLELGKFYRARSGQIWCCFRINLNHSEHCQAYCVLTDGNSERVEYFYLDGRYDSGGIRVHCLLEEVPAGTKST